MSSTPYDGSYRLLFSHPDMVEHLLRGFVPHDWVAQADFSTLEKRNAHYVADSLHQRSDDLVWRLRTGPGQGHWVYVYLLLEFQSRNDEWMALRLLAYVSLLYQDLVRTGEVARPGELPPVFPLVLYNGNTPWRAARSLQTLLRLAPGALARYQPQLHYFVLDEARVPRDDLTTHDNAVSHLIALETSTSVESARRAVAALITQLRAPRHDSLRRAFAVYLRQVLLKRLVPGENIPEIDDLQEVYAMGLAERAEQWTRAWKAEGLAQGRQEGQTRLLHRLLTARFGELPAWVSPQLATGTEADLERWTLAVLTARTLEAVFQPPEAAPL